MDLRKDEKRYYFDDKGHLAAEMTFLPAGKTMLIIDSSFVDDAYRGQGLGKQLLYAIVSDARIKNLKIIPLCPFSKSVFEKEPDLRDVLK